MLPKFSIVSIGVHDEVLNWVAKYKPISIIVVNERGQGRPERPWEENEIVRIGWAMASSPKTLWIFRSWPDGIGENIPGWPLWDRLIKCFEPFRQMSNPLMAHGYNEPGFPWVNTVKGAQALANIEIKFAERIHEAGLLYGGLCFPESHLGRNEQYLWEHLAPALERLDAWIPNEYDWPSVFTSRDQGYKWRIGHWEHQVQRIRDFYRTVKDGLSVKIPPIIIGEGILDGKIKYPHPHGWQKQGGNLKWYVGAHQDVHNDTYHRPEVFGHHTFCYCHPSSEWRSYSVAPILDDLGKLITNQQYWLYDQGGGSMETPEWLIDIRNSVERHPAKKYATRELSKIDTIVVHHTATLQATPEGIARYHVRTRGWPGPAYHIYIRKDGSAYLMNDPETISYHCHNHNHHTIGLAFEGDFTRERPTEAQIVMGDAATVWLLGVPDELGRMSNIVNIKRHRDMPDNQTACPGNFPIEKLGGEQEPDSIQEALQGLARINGKLDGIDYLVKAIREEKDSIEEGLLGL